MGPLGHSDDSQQKKALGPGLRNSDTALHACLNLKMPLCHMPACSWQKLVFLKCPTAAQYKRKNWSPKESTIEWLLRWLRGQGHTLLSLTDRSWSPRTYTAEESTSINCPLTCTCQLCIYTYFCKKRTICPLLCHSTGRIADGIFSWALWVRSLDQSTSYKIL